MSTNASHVSQSRNKKRSVSLRLDQPEYDRIKTISRRMRVRESDVFRFLLDLALAAIAPLDKARCNGTELLPPLLEYASELSTHFRLDAARLDRVVNANTDESTVVDEEDLELLALAGQPHRYLARKLGDITGDPVTIDEALPAMRRYLANKYVKTKIPSN